MAPEKSGSHLRSHNRNKNARITAGQGRDLGNRHR
jgi:hypothetical protein